MDPTSESKREDGIEIDEPHPVMRDPRQAGRFLAIIILLSFGLMVTLTVMGLISALRGTEQSPPATTAPTPGGGGGSRSDGGPPAVGSVAPDFTLEDITTGEQVSLRSLRGKPVWLNFWATWCPPCREEMPDMQKLYEQHIGKGLRIVGIDVEEPISRVSSFRNELGITWTFVIDSTGDVQDRYFVPGLPSHYFIDAQGVIQAMHLGPLEAMEGGHAPVDEYLAEIMAP